MKTKGNSMIHPRPGPIGQNSINTIETKAHMATMTARTLAIRVMKLQGLNRHRKIKEEEKKIAPAGVAGERGSIVFPNADIHSGKK